MKPQDQIRHIKHGFDISTHSFLKNIAESVAKKIFVDANIKLSLSDKTVKSGGKIEAMLTGFTTNADKDLESNVKKSLSDIKSPAALINLLK